MLLVFLVFVPPLLVPVDSQAPGDGAPECKDLSRYASHQQKLLDSWDYVQLLPQVSDETGGVWQTLDVDGNSDGDSVRDTVKYNTCFCVDSYLAISAFVRVCAGISSWLTVFVWWCFTVAD